LQLSLPDKTSAYHEPEEADGVMEEDEVRELALVAPGGYYLGLRVGFAFPLEELNRLPQPWVDHYTRARFMVADPVIRWCYAHTGVIRWSDITIDDPRQVIAQARAFGLRFGVAVSIFDSQRGGPRSFGMFVRGDRDFLEGELDFLEREVQRLHVEKAPPTNLTAAEIMALQLVRDGKRLKQIAWELGVTEGAVKQRLKNARLKLGAKTGAEAISRATGFGLL
jgi:LuxR family transcriptional regulator